MNKSEKLPEIRKEAFTKARESLGLSTKDLSGMSCFSVRQIEQIESGESTSFYGAQVKFTAAKKVAELLKLKPEDAFDFSGVAQPVNPAEVEEKLQEGTKASAAEAFVSSCNFSSTSAGLTGCTTPEKSNASSGVSFSKPATFFAAVNLTWAP